MNTPLDHLPNGYTPCDRIEWRKKGESFKFCFYCAEHNPDIFFVQFDCEGKYYPMSKRRIGDLSPSSTTDGTTISAHECTTRFLMPTTVVTNAQGTYGMGQFVCPDDRVLPRIAGYKDLAVRVDGRFIKSVLDVPVAANSTVTIEGALDEVAHYAMSLGVEELAFVDGGDSYEVFLNRDVSALMMFKNEVLEECRFLFAPTQ